MGKYAVNFNICVVVDDDTDRGETNDIVYDEWTGNKKGLTDNEWNSIVNNAINEMGDISSCVTNIQRVD